MMTTTRFVSALCAAGVFFLLPGTLRAEGDPLKTNDGPGAAVPNSQACAACEIDPIHFGVVRSSAAFHTSASLLFLQATSGNLMYATLVNPFPFPSPHWSDQAVSPDFNPAFNVGLRYDCDGGGDIRLDWTHLNSDDHGSAFASNPYVAGTTTGPPSIQALGPPFLIGPPLPFASARAVSHFDYDTINLEAGLSLSAGGCVQMRTFAGLQGARISQRLSTTFQSVDDSMGFTDVSRSVFTGVGPRLGAELHYVSGHFDVLGGIAGATIIGTRQSHIDFFTASPMNAAQGLTPNVQSLTSRDSTQVIPCIDARVGASYTIPVGNCGVLRCEAGYQATVYINAINQYSLSEVENKLTEDTEGIGSVFLRTAVESQSNFLVHGPYVKFSFQF